MSKNILIAVAVLILILGGFWWRGKTQKNMLTGEKTTENMMAKDAKKVIIIKDFTFSPNILKVKVGETVLIKNEDLSGHSFTSDDGTTFDTGVFGQGESQEITFSKLGTFGYHCTPHPNMKGQIIVE